MGPRAAFNDFIQNSIASSSIVVIATAEQVSHVDVLLRLLLLGLLLCGSSTASGGTTGSSATSSWGGSADVGEELGDVLTFKGLGEESGPVALNGVTAGLDDLAEFLLLLESSVD